MVMAMFVLLGFGVLFLFAFDEGSQGGGQSIESVIAHQAMDIKAFEASLEYNATMLGQTPERVVNAKELGRLKRESQMSAVNVVTLAQRIEATKKEICNENEALEDYKDEYRAYVRGKARGETMDKLVTLTGAVYTNVSIREVTAIGIQIRHGDGQKRIPFEELPEAMNDHFQFDPKQKVQALAEESASRDVHEASVAVTDAMTDQANLKQRSNDAEDVRNKTIRAISSKESRIQALEKEIESLKTSIQQEERKPVSKAPGMRFKVVDNGRAISELRSQIATLRSRL